MPRRAQPDIDRLREFWRRSPFHGGLLGIASVALATVAVGAVCAVVAVIVTAIF